MFTCRRHKTSASQKPYSKFKGRSKPRSRVARTTPVSSSSERRKQIISESTSARTICKLSDNITTDALTYKITLGF